jgi:hypothetical protein
VSFANSCTRRASTSKRMRDGRVPWPRQVSVAVLTFSIFASLPTILQEKGRHEMRIMTLMEEARKLEQQLSEERKRVATLESHINVSLLSPHDVVVGTSIILPQVLKHEVGENKQHLYKKSRCLQETHEKNTALAQVRIESYFGLVLSSSVQWHFCILQVLIERQEMCEMAQEDIGSRRHEMNQALASKDAHIRALRGEVNRLAEQVSTNQPSILTVVSRS